VYQGRFWRSPLALAWFACALQGADAPLRVSIQEAVREALASHPALQAESERMAVSEGLRRQAELKPNPRLILQTENLRAYGAPGFVYGRDADTYAYLSRTFQTSGKREARIGVADANREKARLERELLSRQIAHRVRIAYWNAAGAERTYQLLRENHRTFEQIVEYHRNRVREGGMAEVDLIRVQLESDRLDLAAHGAALDAERARIQLLREMGRDEFPAIELTDALDAAIPEPAAPDIAMALAQRTEMKLAHQAVEQARANQRLQQSLARPDVEGMLGYKRTAGFHTWLAGVQLSLPFADRNQGNIAAAAAEIRYAETAMKATEAIIRAEVDAARVECEIRRRQLSVSLKPLLERAAESARIALAAYREGGADLLRLLDAQRAQIEAQLLYVKTLTEYRQALVTLETAMGVSQ